MNTNFPKFKFSQEIAKFIIGNEYCQSFSLKRQAHVHSLSRKCLPNAQASVTVTDLSVAPSSKKQGSKKNVARSTYSSNKL